jgi:hypothetical protein
MPCFHSYLTLFCWLSMMPATTLSHCSPLYFLYTSLVHFKRCDPDVLLPQVGDMIAALISLHLVLPCGGSLRQHQKYSSVAGQCSFNKMSLAKVWSISIVRKKSTPVRIGRTTTTTVVQPKKVCVYPALKVLV